MTGFNNIRKNDVVKTLDMTGFYDAGFSRV